MWVSLNKVYGPTVHSGLVGHALTPSVVKVEAAVATVRPCSS